MHAERRFGAAAAAADTPLTKFQVSIAAISSDTFLVIIEYSQVDGCTRSIICAYKSIAACMCEKGGGRGSHRSSESYYFPLSRTFSITHSFPLLL